MRRYKPKTHYGDGIENWPPFDKQAERELREARTIEDVIRAAAGQKRRNYERDKGSRRARIVT